MNRRKFVLSSAFGMALLTLSPGLFVSCKKKKGEPNGLLVVIVGAGISGLAAANKLVEEGFTVIILEAQEKVGGRLRTDRSLGVPFDEGASWIHGPSGNPITELAADSGATTFLTSDDSVAVFDIDGVPYAEADLTSAENDFEDAVDDVESSGSLNQSFESVFNSLFPAESGNRLWKYMLSAYLEFSIGGDISKMSSQYFNDDDVFNGADVIITNGYDTIANYLANELDVRLNTRVTSIDYSGRKVKVNTGDEEIKADYVLVTVPLGVLKNNGISFSPALPEEKEEAISSTNMGNVNKFLLVWDTAFWDTSLQYIGYTGETKGKFNYFLNAEKFTTANALMTFAFGDYATTTESMSDSEIISEIMNHLRNIYGADIPEPLSMLRTKWGENENSFGAYSYATKGTTSEDFEILSESVDDKLFFAGEHTSKEYRGTVHGAYLSGEREADKIIDLL